MIELAQRNGITCVLLTRPYIEPVVEELDEDDPAKEPDDEDVNLARYCWQMFAHEYRAATIEVGRANGVLVIDVYRHFEDQREFFTDESHFTGEGHRRAAEIILTEIAPLLPSPPSEFEEGSLPSETTAPKDPTEQSPKS